MNAIVGSEPEPLVDGLRSSRESFAVEPGVRLHESWKIPLQNAFQSESMKQLKRFLVDELRGGKVIYPEPKNWFSALDSTPLPQVKVVLLGQDPYHGPGQAHGLCFSVQKGVPPPPSLKNIFEELRRELNTPIPTHGCLESWARQGVLLLNTVLTVERNRAGSHQNKGWEYFTDEIIRILNSLDRPILFVLWGSPAQKKASMIDGKRHRILKAPHPSPLSAHRGFFGCGHFKEINLQLVKWGHEPIDWRV